MDGDGDCSTVDEPVDKEGGFADNLCDPNDDWSGTCALGKDIRLLHILLPMNWMSAINAGLTCKSFEV